MQVASTENENGKNELQRFSIIVEEELGVVKTENRELTLSLDRTLRKLSVVEQDHDRDVAILMDKFADSSTIERELYEEKLGLLQDDIADMNKRHLELHTVMEVEKGEYEILSKEARCIYKTLLIDELSVTNYLWFSILVDDSS